MSQNNTVVGCLYCSICRDYQTLSFVYFLYAHLYNTGVFLCLQDSLAAEIEGTMRRELSVEEESAFQDQRYKNQI